jgi:hypothetical protein
MRQQQAELRVEVVAVVALAHLMGKAVVEVFLTPLASFHYKALGVVAGLVTAAATICLEISLTAETCPIPHLQLVAEVYSMLWTALLAEAAVHTVTLNQQLTQVPIAFILGK